MAIQPQDRLAGSSHVLRFVGNLVAGASPQVLNATVPDTAPIPADTGVLVIFALADMTALDNEEKRLPGHIFDDNQPASLSPHSNVVTGGPTIGGVPVGKTWEQNVRVRVLETTASTATPLIARVDELTPIAQIDGTAGNGLGQGTGVPCVGIVFHFTAAGVIAFGQAGIGVAVEIEIVDSIER